MYKEALDQGAIYNSKQLRTHTLLLFMDVQCTPLEILHNTHVRHYLLICDSCAKSAKDVYDI